LKHIVASRTSKQKVVDSIHTTSATSPHFTANLFPKPTGEGDRQRSSKPYKLKNKDGVGQTTDTTNPNDNPSETARNQTQAID
jgi:hypothetical protein